MNEITSTNSEKYLINSFLLSGFANVTRKYQVNPIDLLEKHNIPKEALLDPNIILNQIDFLNLINDAAEQTKQPLFGFELTKYFQFESFGIRKDFFEGTNSMHSVPIIFSFYNLTQKSGARIDLATKGTFLLHKISYVFEDDFDTDIYVQISLGLACLMYRKYSLEKYHPVKIALTKYYENTALIEEICGCSVEVESDTNALFLPIDFTFQSPINIEDGKMKRKRGFGRVFLESEFLIEMVKKVIAIHLPWGNSNRDLISKTIGMHYKTLQAALRVRNTSYAKVLQEFRFDEAKKLLSTTDLAITQISLQLGYSETAVFTRSFKKWSGKTPSEWRSGINSNYLAKGTN